MWKTILAVLRRGFITGYLLLAAGYLLVSACNIAIPRFGTGGRYLEGRDQFLRGRGGNMDTAVAALESVVREEPTYKDSLTLLARAYYGKGRYADARQVLQRALAVNKDDEVAWLVLGLTELRLGQDEKGLETIKSGITLVSKLSIAGYRGFPEWDRNSLVRTSIRRAALQALKGLEEKDNLIRAGESVLAQMDNEENLQRPEAARKLRTEF